MGSLLIKLAALSISILLLVTALDLKSSGNDNWLIGMAGSSFFFVLFIGTLLPKKYMPLTIGFTIFSILLQCLASGEALRLNWYSGWHFGRRLEVHLDSILLSEDPQGYWTRMALYFCISIGTIGYGIYNAYFKKQPNNEVIVDQKAVK
ncbi:MAG: hypothetical protein COA90_08700 [Gammaproteobacteria bacterium]|nr:MAG: hypothetical protein COA90_08700 [Gammaproteobacteria bacterium]